MEKEYKELSKKLDSIEKKLQQQVIIELYKSGLSQPEIAKNLGIGAQVVNKLLKGIKKQK